MNLGKIKDAACSATIFAENFLQIINDTCNKYQITTPIRQLCLLAQEGPESGGLYYTEEFASIVAYEGRKTLGNTLIQVTGSANYKRIGDALGVDFIKEPTFLGSKNVKTSTQDQLKYAVLSAGWFWNSRNINAPADKINIHSPIDIVLILKILMQSL